MCTGIGQRDQLESCPEYMRFVAGFKFTKAKRRECRQLAVLAACSASLLALTMIFMWCL